MKVCSRSFDFKVCAILSMGSVVSTENNEKWLNEKNATGKVFLPLLVAITAKVEVWPTSTITTIKQQQNTEQTRKREKSDSIKLFFDVYALQGADNEKIGNLITQEKHRRFFFSSVSFSQPTSKIHFHTIIINVHLASYNLFTLDMMRAWD